MRTKSGMALVVFGKTMPRGKSTRWWRQFDTVLTPAVLKEVVAPRVRSWANLDELVDPGSVVEASAFAEELSRLTLDNGTRLSKVFTYEGYELWWMYYQKLFLHGCVPYSQYRRLLEFMCQFSAVHCYGLPYRDLFRVYLEAHGCSVHEPVVARLWEHLYVPPGVIIQLLWTLVSLPVLMVKRIPILVFTSDQFDGRGDYDFRMKYIYQELRERHLPFMEFIRSLEPWRTVLAHIVVRRRPVVYTEAIAMVGRVLSTLSGGRVLTARRLMKRIMPLGDLDAEYRFRFTLASLYLMHVSDDVWSIRMMRIVLSAIGIHVAYITAAADRNYPTVIASKLRNISTIGILHGVASHHYNVYDFLPAYDGTQSLSVDRYGVWSEWWREYYVAHSKAYRPDQLHISGLLRPLTKRMSGTREERNGDTRTRVLLVSEIVAVPIEVVPYLEALLAREDVSVYVKFRASGDSFETWLVNNRPDLLRAIGDTCILKGSMEDAIVSVDVVVGSQSTGVIESVLQKKPFVLFETKKWGDYFSMGAYGTDHPFYARSPLELVERVHRSHEVSEQELIRLQERFFGDPYRNGSAWVVDQLEEALHHS